MPVVFIAPQDAVHSKIVSNIEEVKRRGGKVIALVNARDAESRAGWATQRSLSPHAGPADPDVDQHSLQLLSYYVAVRRGLQRGSAKNWPIGDVE